MTIRIAFIAAVTLVLSAATVNAQGRPPQKVVLSEAVMKSMAANKPKSKTPLTARVGILRQARTVVLTPGKGAPTSVREISKKR